MGMKSRVRRRQLAKGKLRQRHHRDVANQIVLPPVPPPWSIPQQRARRATLFSTINRQLQLVAELSATIRRPDRLNRRPITNDDVIGPFSSCALVPRQVAATRGCSGALHRGPP